MKENSEGHSNNLKSLRRQRSGHVRRDLKNFSNFMSKVLSCGIKQRTAATFTAAGTQLQ